MMLLWNKIAFSNVFKKKDVYIPKEMLIKIPKTKISHLYKHLFLAYRRMAWLVICIL
jgi:hypothetical protein